MHHRAHERPPHGGFWHVGLHTRDDRWKVLPFVGSHAEADYLADKYRRSHRHVAVYREGQPPRERIAPVLPKSYRPPHDRDREHTDRDRETIQQLLADFVRGNDKATALVLADALLEDGYDWAALDLRETITMGCRARRGLAERILSEVLNGSVVLEHGEWYFPSTGPNPYVLILERTPIYFRGGTRGTSRRREPRIVIWSRYGNRSDLCRWILFGTYDAREFGSMTRAEEVARLDIRDAKVPRANRFVPHSSTERQPAAEERWEEPEYEPDVSE